MVKSYVGLMLLMDLTDFFGVFLTDLKETDLKK